MTGPALVYTLCLAASALCAGLLVRAYLRGRSRLLLWTALAFVCFALNNAFLVADMVLFPTVDLWPWRQATAAAGLLVLIYGFIWEAQ